MTLQIVQDEAADEVLSTNAFALLCGMMLFQQQAPVDVAFAGPAKILDRFGSLDPRAISEASAEEFAELCATEPAVHPYPESMSVLIQALARFIVANYHGNTAAVWQTAASGQQLLARLMLIPGFGKRKAQMFVALLGRQLGVRPPGWEKAAAVYAESGGFRSVADIHDQASLDKVLNPKSARRKGGQEVGKGRQADRRSAQITESEGFINVTSENVTSEEDTATAADDTTEADDRRAARKAARRAARKVQRREGRQEGGDAPATDEDAEPGDLTDERGETLTPEQRAERKAKKVAKRAARRAAAGQDPEGAEGRAGGRRAGGRKGRGGRNRTGESESETDAGEGAESPVPADSAPASDQAG